MAVHISKDKFDEYEAVRQSGLYNMFDPRAREMTNLTKEEWQNLTDQIKEKNNKKDNKNGK